MKKRVGVDGSGVEFQVTSVLLTRCALTTYIVVFFPSNSLAKLDAGAGARARREAIFTLAGQGTF